MSRRLHIAFANRPIKAISAHSIGVQVIVVIFSGWVCLINDSYRSWQLQKIVVGRGKERAVTAVVQVITVDLNQCIRQQLHSC